MVPEGTEHSGDVGHRMPCEGVGVITSHTEDRGVRRAIKQPGPLLTTDQYDAGNYLNCHLGMPRVCPMSTAGRTNSVELTLEQNGFELCGSTYMQIVFNKYIQHYECIFSSL